MFGKRMAKRLIALLVVMAMMVCVMPVGASPPGPGTGPIEVGSRAALFAALETAVIGDVIIITGTGFDLTNQTLNIPAGVTLIFGPDNLQDVMKLQNAVINNYSTIIIQGHINVNRNTRLYKYGNANLWYDGGRAHGPLIVREGAPFRGLIQYYKNDGSPMNYQQVTNDASDFSITILDIEGINNEMGVPGAFDNPGYMFLGWSTQRDDPDPDPAYQPNEVYNFQPPYNTVLVLYAQWGANNYTVTYNANGGEGVMNDQLFKYGVSQALYANAFTHEGYTFGGWALSADGPAVFADGETVNNLTAVNGGVVELFAVWTYDPDQWSTVTFVNGDAMKGTLTGALSFTGIKGKSVPAITAPIATPEYGYQFAGWDTAVPTVYPPNDLTITGNWEEKDDEWSTVTFVNGDPTKGTLTGELVFRGIKGASTPAIVEPGKTPEYGYQFAGWDETLPAVYPLDDLTITGNWEEKDDEWSIVTFVNGDATKGTLTGELVFRGIKGASTPAIVEPGKTPEYGYQFAGWDETVPAVYPPDDLTITGNWEEKDDEWSTVTFVNGDPTKGTLTGELVFRGRKGGSAPVITEPGATPEYGYQFAGWDETIPTVYPLDDLTITGNWEEKDDEWSTVTFVNGDATKGELTGELVFRGIKGGSAPAIVEPGKTPEYGYQFAGWDETVPTVYPSDDLTITGNWEEKDDEWSTVTFVNGDVEKGKLTGELVFRGRKGGSAPSITEPGATPEYGYQFAGWDETIPTVYPLDDLTITGNWNAKSDIVVTFDANGGVAPAPASKQVTYGGAYGELASTSRAGYSFVGWFTLNEDGTEVTVSTIVEKAEPHTLFAHWRSSGSDSTGGGTRLPPGAYPPPPITIFDEETPEGPAAVIFISDHVSYLMGYDDGTMRPEKNVTRAEVATVFYRLLTETMRESNWATGNPFPDVAPGSWYNTAVSVITRMGVIKGYPDGTFKPDNSITRAELAAIAARFARAMAMRGNNVDGFTDISGHWAEADIRHATIIGWVKGYPDFTFKPDQPITRAEFITLANNVLKRIPETTDDLLNGDMVSWSDNADTSAWYYIAMQEASNSHLYEYKEGKTVPGMQFEYENWIAMQENPDWLKLEEEWISQYIPLND